MNYDHKETRYKRHLFRKDYRGSVNGVESDSGVNIGTSADYGPFGSASTTAAEGTVGYNGAEAAGGLVYLRNRWYDPNTGRFTQEDPIGYAGGVNLYAYAGNDPVNYSDPFGLCPDPKDPACERSGLLFSLALSDVAAIGSHGANVQAGLAITSHGDVMLFQTSGKSIGAGAAAGFNIGVQRGTLDGLIAPSGKGGGVAASATVPGMGGSVKFNDNHTLAGISAGPGGPLALSIDSTSAGHGSSTYSISDAFRRSADEAKQALKDAARAMTCPAGCTPP